MNIQDVLFKLGIPTYVYVVETQLTANAEIKIGETLPVDLGWIYGMSVNINGCSPKDSTKLNILPGQSASLFLTLKYGQSLYVNNLRVSELIYTQPEPVAQSLFTNSNRYLSVNIPLNTDLKQSFFANPTLITGRIISLNLYYVDLTSYRTLVNEGILLRNGKKISS